MGRGYNLSSPPYNLYSVHGRMSIYNLHTYNGIGYQTITSIYRELEYHIILIPICS